MRPDAFWWIVRQSVRLAGWGFHLDKVADGLLDIEFAGYGAGVLTSGCPGVCVTVADRVSVAVSDEQRRLVRTAPGHGGSAIGPALGVGDGDRVVIAHLVRRAGEGRARRDAAGHLEWHIDFLGGSWRRRGRGRRFDHRSDAHLDLDVHIRERSLLVTAAPQQQVPGSGAL